MKKWVHSLSGIVEHWGLAGMIATKITCVVGMNLSLLLGLLGASGAALPFLDSINRAIGPISLPLFLVSLAFMALGAIRRGPIALALVLGGGLLLYAAVFVYGMNVPLYGVAMVMLLIPFLAQPVRHRLQPQRAGEDEVGDVGGVTNE
jgi:hypothetical protein